MDHDLLLLARRAFDESARAQAAAAESLAAPLLAAACRIAESLRRGGTLFVFGNGGSAADAQHLVGELVGRYHRDRRPLAAVALGTDAATSTGIANDYAFDEVFSRPLAALGRPGDVALGITTSGRSPNVLRALAVARERDLATIALLGASDVPLAASVDVAVQAPATSTARIQEVHTTAIHALTELLEALLVEPAPGAP